ncbi:sigma-70 family RNA polymerase sigma factor [Nakamurella sp. A5-74]|uniref:Sigma-70 family RNA polymerase sigma factor n=1 Tax=Nakamurella sp. A5-74 TaxID=3158264 RepID=A0AAU8DNM9_9ACTN
MLIEDVGATGSVAELFRLHYLPLVRLAIQLVDTQADAEDVVQDVFAALDPDRIVGTAEHYLTRAVLNRCRSVLRRRRTARLFHRAPRPSDVPAADAEVLIRERARTIRACVDALPTRQREVLVLRYFAGRSVAETAELLGVTPGAVTSSASRALTALATTLEDHDVRSIIG